MIKYECNLRIEPYRNGWYLLERSMDAGRYLYNKIAGKMAKIPEIADIDLISYIEKQISSEEIVPMKFFSPENFIKQNKTPRLMIYLTASCNLGCTYCHCNSGGPNGEMSDQDALKIVQKYIDHVTRYDPKKREIEITFMGGGEPLLRLKGIKRVVKYVGETGFAGAYTLVTNGTVASDKDWDWLIDNQFRITISADGPPEIQNMQRPFFKKQAETAKFLEKRLMMLGDRAAEINIRSTVMDFSKEAIDTICEYFNRFPAVVTHHLEPLSPAGRAFGLPPKNDGLYQNFFEHYASYLYSHPERYKSAWFKPFNKTNGFCGAVYYNTIVTHDGYVSLCAEVDASMRDTSYGKKYIVSHVDDENAFRSEKANDFTRNNSTENLAPCKTCVIQHKCGGGCYIKRDRDYPGDWDTFIRNYCDQAVPLNMSYLIGLYEARQ